MPSRDQLLVAAVSSAQAIAIAFLFAARRDFEQAADVGLASQREKDPAAGRLVRLAAGHGLDNARLDLSDHIGRDRSRGGGKLPAGVGVELADD